MPGFAPGEFETVDVRRDQIDEQQTAYEVAAGEDLE